MFHNVYDALKPGGVFLLNVSNNRMLLDGSCDLERAACTCAENAGFAEEPTLRLLKPRWTSAGGARTRQPASRICPAPIPHHAFD